MSCLILSTMWSIVNCTWFQWNIVFEKLFENEIDFKPNLNFHVVLCVCMCALKKRQLNSFYSYIIDLFASFTFMWIKIFPLKWYVAEYQCKNLRSLLGYLESPQDLFTWQIKKILGRCILFLFLYIIYSLTPLLFSFRDRGRFQQKP